jgi:hypothetical protein
MSPDNNSREPIRYPYSRERQIISQMEAEFAEVPEIPEVVQQLEQLPPEKPMQRNHFVQWFSKNILRRNT